MESRISQLQTYYYKTMNAHMECGDDFDHVLIESALENAFMNAKNEIDNVSKKNLTRDGNFCENIKIELPLRKLYNSAYSVFDEEPTQTRIEKIKDAVEEFFGVAPDYYPASGKLVLKIL